MESCSISRNEIVEAEVQIMQSAYTYEFEDLRDTEKTLQPPDVRIKLGPCHSQGGTLHSHISAVIRITTTIKYPEEPAEVVIESSEGITDKESKELEAELKNVCIEFSKVGQVVMMEISHHTQNFLSEHARPYIESIHAEMVAGWKAKEEALQQAQAETIKKLEQEEEERRIFRKEELDKLQEAVKEEARERKRLKSFNHDCLDGHGEKRSPIRRWMRKSVSESIGDCLTREATETNSISFTTTGKQELHISLQENLGERPEQSCEITLGQEKESKERFVMYTWCVLPKKHGKSQLKVGEEFLLEEFLSKMNNVEKEMSSLLKLSHENLVPFKAMKVVKFKDDFVCTHILQEFVQGLSLKYLFDSKIPLNESFVHHVASGVIKALDYLHLNNVVHRNLRDSCVFFDQQCGSVRLSDYGVERRCVEIALEFGGREPLSLYPISPGRGGKKCDVFRFGILILSLYLGERVNQVAPSLPSRMSKTLKNFLTHCLELVEQDRWTAHQLAEHPFIVNYERNLEPNLNQFEASKCESQLPLNAKGHSRFYQEYDIHEWLGKGGYGHVYKVRNKVDDRVYALKRIPLHQHPETTRRKMTREVKLLSSLNHENVVRYYTSWIESFSQEQLEERGKSSIDGRALSSENPGSYEETDDNDAGFIESESEQTDRDWLMPSLSSSNDKEESDGILFLDSSKDELPPNRSKDAKALSTKHSSHAFQPKKLQYLFIQMQYCEKNTLRQAIDHNLCLEEDRVWQLFREITNGLDYIHSQGLIHRDLKPGNVFLDSNDRIKIGDFGLATVAFKDVNNTNDSNQVNAFTMETKDSSALTGHVGTALYIAPELTKISGKVSYTNKVDLYSLGIIFFEMVYPLSTGMERVKLLSQLRHPQPQFPEDFKSQGSDKKQKLILWLLNHDPLDRPSTEELLKSSLLPPPTAEEQKFMTTLESKIENVTSKDYQDILNLLFKPRSRPELEATFEVYLHKLGAKQLFMYDFIKEQITSIFRSHGGIWVPTSFYIPRGSFYQEKDNLVSLMSKGGEFIAAQFELRYPFARFVARTDLKRIRRYNIDRVQRAHRISVIHPTEIYECAFDIIASKPDLAESCGRVLIVAQEILQNVSGLSASQVTLRLCHSELVKAILNYSGLEEGYHTKAIGLLHDFRGLYLQVDQFGECLREIGVDKSSIETLKVFLQMEGTVSDVCSILQSRLLSSNSRRRHLFSGVRAAIAELKEIAQAVHVMGAKFEIIFRPLMVVDHSLYRGISFQLAPQTMKKSNLNILAQGGSYDHLITHERNQSLSATKRMEGSISAVGISLPLERVVAISTNRDEGETGSEILLSEIFICAIEQRQLKDRVDLAKKLKAENIVVDHGFAMTFVEAEGICEELWFIPHFVFLYPSRKVILRSNDNVGVGNSAFANNRKINRHELFECLTKLVKFSKTHECQAVASNLGKERKENVKSSFKLEDFTPNIEYFIRKQTRVKDYAKLEAQIIEEVTSCLCSRWSIVGESVEIIVVDLEKKALLALGQLDVESTVKSFNDSVGDLKIRFPDIKDYMEKICKSLLNMIFYRKKADRPAVICCFSIISESLKRIL